ncbi:MAG: hypothetical protein EHM77_06190, partial [Planctomycetaceae bacterium]
MAGYGNISATSYMVQPYGPADIVKIISNDESLTSDKLYTGDTDNKIYIPIYLKSFRVIGCVDSGSDLTIIHLSVFMKIFRNMNILNLSPIQYIHSFSDHKIKVRGVFPACIRLNKGHPGISVSTYVIDDIPNVPPVLLGNDMLKLGMVTLSYTGATNAPLPEIIFKYPSYHQCEVYFEPAKLLYTCDTVCNLAPFEVQDVEFILPKAAPVIRTDHILITSQEWDTVSIIPSRSDLEYIEKFNRYVATGRVANLSDRTIKCHIRGKYELVNDYNAINVNNDNRGRLSKALVNYPWARE